MIPVVFINCGRHPFLDMMLSGDKIDETRTRNTLRTVIGPVFLAETGRGKSPLVRAFAVIGDPVIVRSRDEWNRLRDRHRIPVGSPYDWTPETKVKYLYPIFHIEPVPPFTPPPGRRHGRVWMEYDETEVQ